MIFSDFNIFIVSSKVPGWVVAIAPANALKIEEKAWNAFPHCRTELTVNNSSIYFFNNLLIYCDLESFYGCSFYLHC